MMARLKELWKELFMEDKKIITFGDVLDLIDNMRLDEQEIIVHGDDESALRGPMCCELWEPLEDRAVDCIGISDDPFFEIWLEDEDDGEG